MGVSLRGCRAYMSYSLNSLKEGYIADYIGYYDRGYQGEC